MSTISDKIALRVAERNSWTTYSPKKLMDTVAMLRGRSTEMQSAIPTEEWLDSNFPMKSIDWDLLRNPKSNSIIQSTWVGHASVFVQMGNFNILTDPIFSDRCSGVQWAGPKRFRRPAFTIEELMLKEKVAVDVVLISHNHYDHLDYNSVTELAELAVATNHPIDFIVPLGLRSWFKKYVPKSFVGGNKVTELDWHESHLVRSNKKEGINITVTSVPMQHWSSRFGYDRDKTLWCGFSVKAFHDHEEKQYDARLLFAGDTGLFDGADEIGKQYGPFDLAAIPSKFR